MSAGRDAAADAALHLIGTEGMRALTHGRVDAAAGLPRGSASNHFRTRLALIEGAVERLDERDRRRWAEASGDRIRSLDDLVDAAAGFFAAATGPDRELTVARYTLSVESMVNDGIREAMRRSRLHVEQWVTTSLRALDVDGSLGSTPLVVDYLNGVILDRMAFLGVPDPRPGLRTVLRALVQVRPD